MRLLADAARWLLVAMLATLLAFAAASTLIMLYAYARTWI